MKTLDHHIDTISAPMLTPIIDLYRMEGAPFISGFNETTPFSRIAQAYIAGEDIILNHKFLVNDTQESTSQELSFIEDLPSSV